MLQHMQVKAGCLLIFAGNEEMQTRLADALQKDLLNSYGIC